MAAAAGGYSIAPTKTLAKVANHLAKTMPELNGVCVLDTVEAIDEVLWGFSDRGCLGRWRSLGQ